MDEGADTDNEPILIPCLFIAAPLGYLPHFKVLEVAQGRPL